MECFTYEGAAHRRASQSPTDCDIYEYKNREYNTVYVVSHGVPIFVPRDAEKIWSYKDGIPADVRPRPCP